MAFVRSLGGRQKQKQRQRQRQRQQQSYKAATSMACQCSRLNRIIIMADWSSVKPHLAPYRGFSFPAAQFHTQTHTHSHSQLHPPTLLTNGQSFFYRRLSIYLIYKPVYSAGSLQTDNCRLPLRYSILCIKKGKIIGNKTYCPMASITLHSLRVCVCVG